MQNLSIVTRISLLEVTREACHFQNGLDSLARLDPLPLPHTLDMHAHRKHVEKQERV